MAVAVAAAGPIPSEGRSGYFTYVTSVLRQHGHDLFDIRARHPVTKQDNALSYIITTLYDYTEYGWSREQILAWLEEIGL